jgi:5-methylcytosine-specific restriction endonuclease McrA
VSDRQCAYCGSEGNLTREHLWPTSLHKRLSATNDVTQSLFWLRRINAEIEGEPTIRDVCSACNNGPLSNLDAYSLVGVAR